MIQQFLALIPAVLLLACCHTHATYIGGDIMPTHEVDTLSTNWMAAVKGALPAKYLGKDILTFQEATNLLCQESQHGNNAAQGLWGFVMLVQSRSVDEAKAGLELLRNSATKGYVPAMLQLGFLFEGGKYVQRDYNEAFHWFSMGADKGDAEAELQLGGCYHYSLGTKRDFSMAAIWYRRSVEQTNYVAMKSLGYLLMNGLGVGKDSEAAKYWLTRAAKEGVNTTGLFCGWVKRVEMVRLGRCPRPRPTPTSLASLSTFLRGFPQGVEGCRRGRIGVEWAHVTKPALPCLRDS